MGNREKMGTWKLSLVLILCDFSDSEYILNLSVQLHPGFCGNVYICTCMCCIYFTEGWKMMDMVDMICKVFVCRDSSSKWSTLYWCWSFASSYSFLDMNRPLAFSNTRGFPALHTTIDSCIMLILTLALCAYVASFYGLMTMTTSLQIFVYLFSFSEWKHFQLYFSLTVLNAWNQYADHCFSHKRSLVYWGLFIDGSPGLSMLLNKWKKILC